MSGLDNGINTSYGYSHVLTFLQKCDSNNQQHVVLKEARDSRSFNAEVNALDGYLRGHNSFRQLVNVTPDQKSWCLNILPTISRARSLLWID